MMNLDADDFIYDLVVENDREFTDDERPADPSDEPPYDPWDSDDAPDRRHDPLRPY